MTALNNVVASLQKEKARLETELGQITKALAALGHVTGGGGNNSRGRRRRTLSVEARRRIAEAQRARWARVRKAAEKK